MDRASIKYRHVWRGRSGKVRLYLVFKNDIRTAINQYRAFIHSITESNGGKGRRASVHCRFVIITQRRIGEKPSGNRGAQLFILF